MAEQQSLETRILNLFVGLQETTFFPNDIQTSIDNLMQPKTWTDYITLPKNHFNQINNVLSNEYHKFLKDYKEFVSDLEKTENVFSFDIDYI